MAGFFSFLLTLRQIINKFELLMKKTFVLAALSFLAIGMNAQNLIKNGTFDTPLNAETYESVPASADSRS